MRFKRRPNPPFSDNLIQTIALSWITKLYAKYGTDEQLDKIYDKWHTGEWGRRPGLDMPNISTAEKGSENG